MEVTSYLKATQRDPCGFAQDDTAQIMPFAMHVIPSASEVPRRLRDSG